MGTCSPGVSVPTKLPDAFSYGCSRSVSYSSYPWAFSPLVPVPLPAPSLPVAASLYPTDFGFPWKEALPRMVPSLPPSALDVPVPTSGSRTLATAIPHPASSPPVPPNPGGDTVLGLPLPGPPCSPPAHRCPPSDSLPPLPPPSYATVANPVYWYRWPHPTPPPSSTPPATTGRHVDGLRAIL